MVEIPEEEYEELAECPTCGADISIDALVCPNCGQEFEEEEEEEEEYEEGEETAVEGTEAEEVEYTEEVVEETTVASEPEEEFLSLDLDEEDVEPEQVNLDELIEEGLVEGEAEEVELEGAEYVEDDGEYEEGEEYEYEEEGEVEYADDEAYEPEESVVAAVAVAAPIDEPMEPLDEILVDEEKPAKMFWIGVILILLGFFGGPILSYLHDALRIPIGIFKAYENFGWVNWLTTIIGTIMLAIGVLLLVIGWAKIRQWRERMEALLAEPEPMAEAID